MIPAIRTEVKQGLPKNGPTKLRTWQGRRSTEGGRVGVPISIGRTQAYNCRANLALPIWYTVLNGRECDLLRAIHAP
jgi:hypothetical protein